MLLKLFAVRTFDTKEAVGFFWTRDLETLSFMVDAAIDPGTCEYCLIDAPAAVMWLGDAPAMGVEREDIEDQIDDRGAMKRGVSFEFALEDVLYGYGEIVSWTELA
ncbi:hypothetical protein [Bradyrhizobium sp. JYMT SZCCT0428]|uniref:hypothetical protein n=1 Tax=Bradyrhizobium sp. JYMT SZCCT0428 TaxID=2807673 RepID=UPI001BAC07E9|nr:hypothetical protein [Bradyrhizobium sp. JYMT SZCCT0428]MBR1149475.1 hypothetical protein [Bradyrhizobium sp. JYMT SZCCT0428]